jgi:hypothetical protein
MRTYAFNPWSTTLTEWWESILIKSFKVSSPCANVSNTQQVIHVAKASNWFQGEDNRSGTGIGREFRTFALYAEYHSERIAS